MRSRWRNVDLRMAAVAGTALAAVLVYVLISALGRGPGFPLDDGWIHQTYARNLARTGRWEYVPGVVSAGSTSPLWTIWLAVGHWLRLPLFFWSFGSGALCLAWLGVASGQLWRALWPPRAAAAQWVGMAVVLTWPLIWAAGSGMETLLFIALGMQCLAWLANGEPLSNRRALGLGVGGGLMILVRPDGLILLLLLAAGVGVGPGARLRPGKVLRLGAGAVLPLLPYFLFNYWASGQWWPNTLYAKQAEYAVLLARSLPLRFLELLYFTLGGPPSGWRGISAAHLLLLPGVVVAGWRSLRQAVSQRTLMPVLPLLWAGGHVLLYAWRLPVTYQHGRYLLAAVPVWVVFGLSGWALLIVGIERRLGALSRRVAVTSYAALTVVFLLLGLLAYVQDVDFIEAEMVTTARWLNDNTPEDTRIAAHDIGAIGYWTERPLIDLAGLITPELVPYLTDEAALAGYLDTTGAELLVTAPGWPYTGIIQMRDAELQFTTGYSWTRERGLNNMAVYALPAR